jgi:multicomponent Na+:H+ antiporter subunit D
VPGVSLEFRLDALGMTFALLASGLWIVTTLYSSGYVRADDVKHRRRYFASFAAASAPRWASRSPATCSPSSSSTRR